MLIDARGQGGAKLSCIPGAAYGAVLINIRIATVCVLQLEGRVAHRGLFVYGDALAREPPV